MKLKIVVAITVMINYNLACVQAQIPSRSLDYIHDIHDYYDTDTLNYDPETTTDESYNEYSDDLANNQKIQFSEALLKQLKNKYKSLKAGNQAKKHPSNFKGPCYQEKQQRPQKHSSNELNPHAHTNNPYQSHIQPMHGGMGLNLHSKRQQCLKKKRKCLKRCKGADLTCKEACTIHHECY